MDWRTAAESVALVVLAAWNVVAHIRVGRVKDQQIATLKSQVEQVTALTFKGANDQIAALDQLHKREIEILKRQHEIELEAARGEAATAEQLAEELAETKRQLAGISSERGAFMDSLLYRGFNPEEAAEILKDKNAREAADWQVTRISDLNRG